MLEHARLLADWFGEARGVRAFRKQSIWYTKGFPGGTHLRRELVEINTLDDLAATLAKADPDLPFPPSAMRVPRGKKSGTQRVALPEGYLDDLDDATPPGPEAEEAISGG
jgi:hypothetical protein